jgi:hypothetical protein
MKKKLFVLKEEIKKKNNKTYSSQLWLTNQTHDPYHEIEITPYKTSKKNYKTQFLTNQR